MTPDDPSGDAPRAQRDAWPEAWPNAGAQATQAAADDVTLRDRELIDLFVGEMRGLLNAMETQTRALAESVEAGETNAREQAQGALFSRRGALDATNAEARHGYALRNLRRLANALTDLTATFHVDDCSALTGALAAATESPASGGIASAPGVASRDGALAPTLTPEAALATISYLRQRADEMAAAGDAIPASATARAATARLLLTLGAPDPAASQSATLAAPNDIAALDELEDEAPASDELSADDLEILRSFQASALDARPGARAFLSAADAVDLSGARPMGRLVAIPEPSESASGNESLLAFDASLTLAPDAAINDTHHDHDSERDTAPLASLRRPIHHMPTADELDQIPPEMKRLFIVESTEDLQDIGGGLLELEQRPNDHVILMSMSRVAHKMKGVAGTLGFDVFADIAITLEIVLKAAQKHQITVGPATLGALSRILGALKQALNAAAAGENGDPALANEAQAVADALLQRDSAAAQLNTVAETARQSPIAPPLGGEADSLARVLWSGETETLLRVDIQRLDDLMNRLSGMSINRASLTQTRNDIMRVQNEMEVALQRLATMSAQITDQHPFESALERMEQMGQPPRVGQFDGFAVSSAGDWGRFGGGPASPPGATTRVGAMRLAGPPARRADDAWDELEQERFTEVDHALRALGEVVGDVGALNMTLRTLLVRLGQISETQEGLMTQMQHDAMQMRLTPLAGLLPRLQLAVRALAADLGKSVNFTVRGEMTEIDRNISDALAEPLVQLVRNAVAHGIETPEERIEQGKPPTGSVWLRAYYVGAEVTIEIGDDGHGINPNLLIASAVAVGMIDQEQARDFTPEDAYALMFRPGVTTIPEPQVMGGAGVGLDEVDSAIRRLKGSVQAQSEPGRGTVFRLRVPISLSIVRALHIVAAGQSFAAPFSSVQRTVTIAPAELLPPTTPRDGAQSDPGVSSRPSAPPPPRIRIARARDTLSLASASDLGLEGVMESAPLPGVASQADPRRYEEIPVFALAELLGYEHQPREPQLALIVEVGQRRAALLIDEARDDMEVVVRTLPKHLRRRAIRGATAQPDGETLLLLDLPELIAQRLAGTYVQPRPRPTPTLAQTPAPRALIVDDSVTIRRTLQLTLERAGFETQAARDGLEALDMIMASPPRVIILDVEMPRLNGFELLSIVRAAPQFAAVRVVMLTSRAAHKHRDYAYSLGADAYLVKPCPQEVLISTVRQLLETPDNTPEIPDTP